MAAERASRDVNYVTTIMGLDLSTGLLPTNVYVDETTHRLLVSAVITPTTLPATIRNSQQTVTTSAVALPSGALTQGVILEALSTNTVSIFVGGSGVTTSTGTELQPGASTSVAVSNTNVIYVICATGSPVVTWIGS